MEQEGGGKTTTGLLLSSSSKKSIAEGGGQKPCKKNRPKSNIASLCGGPGRESNYTRPPFEPDFAREKAGGESDSLTGGAEQWGENDGFF